ncbi:hypothetical protein [Prauserella flavalba]|uniref:hypothetical protein n=1 Tax=Prauserella flavalba TaxID=1477506 RepID=UPI001FECDBDD|nr:hypothetical protein [Prauserella flavalba]
MPFDGHREHGTARLDDDPARPAITESFGARARPLRDLATGTRAPLMRMYATGAPLRVGVSHARATPPTLLEFVHRTGFPAERVTTLAADWADAQGPPPPWSRVPQPGPPPGWAAPRHVGRRRCWSR